MSQCVFLLWELRCIASGILKVAQALEDIQKRSLSRGLIVMRLLTLEFYCRPVLWRQSRLQGHIGRQWLFPTINWLISWPYAGCDVLDSLQIWLYGLKEDDYEDILVGVSQSHIVTLLFFCFITGYHRHTSAWSQQPPLLLVLSLLRLSVYGIPSRFLPCSVAERLLRGIRPQEAIAIGTPHNSHIKDRFTHFKYR